MKTILILVFVFYATCQAAPSVELDNAESAQDTNTNQTISVLNESPAELQFVKIGEKSYYIDSTSKVNWFAAWNFCRTKNLNLIMVNSAKEHDELVTYLKKLSTSFWTSLNNWANKDEWIWAPTGNKATYFNWGVGEPNNLGGHEHCMELRSVTDEILDWNDLDCERELSFVCEDTANETSAIVPEKSNAVHVVTKALTWTWSKVL